MKKKILTLGFVAMILASPITLLAGECTVRISCGLNDNDFVECSGQSCQRSTGVMKKSNYVKCDGVETYCTGGDND